MEQKHLALLRVWVEGERKALEWSVGGRTFQILGLKGSEGVYERFFGGASHPTRRPVGEIEALEVLQNATSPFELYRGEKGSGEHFATIDAALDAAKKWLEQK